MDPAQVVQAINNLTQKSQALHAPAQSLSVLHGPLLQIGQGPFPRIISALDDIVSTMITTVTHLKETAPISEGAQSDRVFDSFREFSRVHTQLLNILIGKAGLYASLGNLLQPVASILRRVDGAVDTLVFTLRDIVESRASDIQSEGESLHTTISTATKSYEDA